MNVMLTKTLLFFVIIMMFWVWNIWQHHEIDELTNRVDELEKK